LGELLANAPLWSEVPLGILVPVPLSAQRQHERGYNQARLLALAVAASGGLRMDALVVRRNRHTASQVGLSVRQRQANVKGAFSALNRANGHTYILIDDVCTTGATLGACATALLEAGAKAVWGVTLARARRVGPPRPAD
jgi:ComF family protein